MPLTDDPDTDEQLARRAAGGSAAAFDALARRYQVPLLRFLLARRGGDRHAAEDAVQETFLKLYRSIGRFDPARPFRTWAFAVAYRTWVDGRRRRRGPTADADDHPAAPAPPDADPARRAAADDAGRHLWDVARKSLSAEQFTALWLYYVEDLPTAEVAAVTGRSDVWVRTALTRGRRALAIHLRPQHEGVA